MQTHIDQNQEGHDVVAWRRDRLVDAGFSPLLAVRLARDSGYDLHGVVELVERGCLPDLAVRILAPLEEGIAA